MYYLNTDVQSLLYQKVVNNKIFVDKSMLIEKISRVIGTENPYVCITRPRRFGKTINANMLGAYSYVELAYMTGILPVAKYSSGSERNMFDEYNFMNDNTYDAYFGFHEAEVQKLCWENASVSYEEMKQWYDGYYTSEGKSLFNPRSVSRALTRGVCLNYWTETGHYSGIKGRGYGRSSDCPD